MGGSEVEKKVSDYSQEIRLGLLKEAYKKAAEKIIDELGLDKLAVFSSSYTPLIISELTDEQLKAAEKSENIDQITVFSNFTLNPLTEFADKNSFIEFFTTDTAGNPVLGDDIKIDAIMGSGKDKASNYLIVYGLSDVKEIDKVVDKLNKGGRFMWGSPIDTFSGGVYSSINTNSNVQLIVFADDVLPGFTGIDIARYSEEVGFDVKPYISFLGDSNGDFKLDSLDASVILSAYAKVQTSNDFALSEADIKRMDVDGNGSVDAVDASCILSYYTHVSTGGSGTLRDFLKNKNE